MARCSGDYSPGRLVNFQKTIYRLRRALGQDIITYDEETQQYRFNRSLDYTYDVDLFRMYLLEARTAMGAAEQAKAYRQALDLYRGPYLANEDALWIWPEREALAEAYREAALELAELDLQGICLFEHGQGAINRHSRVLHDQSVGKGPLLGQKGTFSGVCGCVGFTAA